MKYLYYPGCSLKSSAAELEKSALGVAGQLGIELTEINKWYCCGVLHSLAVDSEMYFVASARNLSKTQVMARELNAPQELVTICPMCDNTLKLVNVSLKSNQDKLNRVNKFMDTEEPYKGEVKVIHILELLRELSKNQQIEKHVKRSLNQLKVAPYYGCMLLRPREISFVDPNNPEIFETMINSAGGISISYPKRDECCGSYQTAVSKDLALRKSSEILSSAKDWDAQLMVTTCPLCHFNLKLCKDELEKSERRRLIPVLYLTELLCYAFDLDEALTDGSKALIDELLKSKVHAN
jgi:heterodisulfide reductase subunit B